MRWGIKGNIVTPQEVIPGLVVMRENHIEDVLPYPGKEDLEVVYDFKDNFNLEDDYFFIPQIDSPLLQGGVDQVDSGLTIPEFDFFGKNRLIGGIGIDIGAVQVSGYIR